MATIGTFSKEGSGFTGTTQTLALGSLNPDYPFFDDLLDLDVLRTDEGIRINAPEKE